ncbi:hypothetical protein C8F04DRAFT_1129301 [Mycena alexandri]|uniref:Uncharacterized protein n=1 Tax=Mycena alexandri TaxID=1745969 RepID=A0AAD6SD12_9AGAR|nr:hypothetical protein C8F04DRAFT_1129301 [Mycena alexandri]
MGLTSILCHCPWVHGAIFCVNDCDRHCAVCYRAFESKLLGIFVQYATRKPSKRTDPWILDQEDWKVETNRLARQTR